jgi:hypothetical protein
MKIRCDYGDINNMKKVNLVAGGVRRHLVNNKHQYGLI